MYGKTAVFMDVTPFNLINVPKFWWILVPPSLWCGDCAKRFLQNFSTSLSTYKCITFDKADKPYSTVVSMQVWGKKCEGWSYITGQPCLTFALLESDGAGGLCGAAGGRPSLRSMQHHENIPQQKSHLIIRKWIRIISSEYLDPRVGEFFVTILCNWILKAAMCCIRAAG